MFDTKRFLEDQFTDADGVMGLTGRHCNEQPQRETVRKWFSRGSVPSEWWPVLLQSLRSESGIYPDLTPYFSETGHGIFG